MTPVLLAANGLVQTITIVVVAVVGLTFVLTARVLTRGAVQPPDDHTRLPEQPADLEPGKD
ncbi:hypothetical protein HUN58_11615 [Curtobacterium sp. Csp1]|uniref:hypothetical protein n=1 Tax=unclassified Curtobacterium TaxID=257496 RepID=UPI000E0B53F2|nr:MULTISPECIES: hypothetical protein [unclassified Curtobacterium]QKS12284.1 hypothetical protein HUN60_03360 [Curtobacterium sp. csp3]QKS19869.1 hypothetical protein HUN58_07965 [Curtobacterium sp. Csp1]QKS20484.1 hypothetical protein HUN58_11615 [Curtobacterium sp. Csp1]RDI02203.1 hypothetical protein DEU32_101106 [Curtobacterium sp. AG1037]